MKAFLKCLLANILYGFGLVAPWFFGVFASLAVMPREWISTYWYLGVVFVSLVICVIAMEMLLPHPLPYKRYLESEGLS